MARHGFAGASYRAARRVLAAAPDCTVRFVLIVALCAAPVSALAHAYLTKSVPAQRAVVLTPPERVQLWFNERLEPAFCTLTVTDAAGASVDQADTHVASDDPKQLTVSLKLLSAGVYTVKFRVLSVDGHVVTDQFTFTIRARR